MEDLVVMHWDHNALAEVFRGRRVFVTGHTGFKGGWLAVWLANLGADVVGYSLPPDSRPNLYESICVERHCRSIIADLRDRNTLDREIRSTAPEVVLHLAAQPLVRRSYQQPLDTLETNVLGTAAVLDSVRRARVGCVIVVITSDKCYAPRGSVYGHREDEPLGGYDPYSASKAATEIVVESYRHSFFPVDRLGEHGVRLASARAGNVIGGGDWSDDRLVPDCVRALQASRPAIVRNPRSIRPWQHVLEPLGGYLQLTAMMLASSGVEAATLCQAWNFGPRPRDSRTVGELAAGLVAAWGAGSWEERSDPAGPRETPVLRLSIEKAERELGWAPRWSVEDAVSKTVEWYRAQGKGASPEALEALTIRQIHEYEGTRF